MFIIRNFDSQKKFSLNIEELSGTTQTYTDVYGFKMSVASGIVLVDGSQYPKLGESVSITGFGILDYVKIDSIVVDATGGSCHIQYLSEVTI